MPRRSKNAADVSCADRGNRFNRPFIHFLKPTAKRITLRTQVQAVGTASPTQASPRVSAGCRPRATVRTRSGETYSLAAISSRLLGPSIRPSVLATMDPMRKAAKEKSSWFWFIALALLTCAPSFASSIDVEHGKTRVELFLLEGQNRTGQQTFDTANRVENYDSAWEVASESSVAPNRLATSSDEAVFWSGVGRGGAKRAAAWVSEHGGATLETTLANRGIKLPRWNPDDPAVVAAWRQASIDFASRAKGHIRVLQGDSLRVNAIFHDEFNALIANPNVKSITSINPETGVEVLLWSR